MAHKALHRAQSQVVFPSLPSEDRLYGIEFGSVSDLSASAMSLNKGNLLGMQTSFSDYGLEQLAK